MYLNQTSLLMRIINFKKVSLELEAVISLKTIHSKPPFVI